VVGGGRLAARRVGELLRARARVTVVAPAVSDELEALAAEGAITVARRAVLDGDMTGAALVVVATDDDEVNVRASESARSAGALVTVVDRPDLGQFTTPAVVRRGLLTLTASTGGASPALAGYLGRLAAVLFGPEWADVVEAVGELRAALRSRFPGDARRREGVTERALALDLAAIARSSGRAGLDARLFALLDAGAAPPVGTVYLVGAGPGDPGLLTVRGAQLLARADAVVHDSLVPAEILALVPERAERHFVGKRGGARHQPENVPQRETNELLVALAASHSVVVRLKGGDPFLFGRGAEEAEYLRARGVPVEVVPGVSSALAVPAAAGIPVTHRDHASAVVIASGHRRADRAGPAQDWARIGGLDATVVVLMGVGTLGEIAAGLIAGGRHPDTPAALVEWGTTSRQRELFATIATIAEKAREEDFAAPSVLVVGHVVTACRRGVDEGAERKQA
jgi:uroporphyrin-III C-methyltransferase/precorrin-2 dehydrogenase/sirohydrochlorin ferrochelatase